MDSFWNINNENNRFASLDGDIQADVCVIGGGLTGLTTAYYLSKEGKKVVVLEKDVICSGTSGGTTGKVTSQHGLIYKYLKDSNGKEFARKYYEANEKAIKDIEKIINEEKIECDFEKKKAYVYTESKNEIQNIKNEVEVTNKLDIDSKFVDKIDLPLEIFGAIQFQNQAQFNPVKYANGLVKSLLKNGVAIYEKSKAMDVLEDDEEYTVTTINGSVNAKYVVIATRYPIITFPGYYFLKMYQSTSYALIVDTNTDLQTDGYYINSETPQISLRTVKDGDKNLLLIVGYDYKTGSEIIGNPFDYLFARVKRMFPKAEIVKYWTAEDCISLDKIPYIGDFSNVLDNVYVATGFNKWGMTSSNISANIITDKIMGRENEYEEIFRSSRLEIIKNKDEAINMLKESVDGIVVKRIKGKPTPTCTHLGCKLSWNQLEETWDCPCHGSRYTKRGFVIESPAVSNLEID